MLYSKNKRSFRRIELQRHSGGGALFSTVPLITALMGRSTRNIPAELRVRVISEPF